MGYVQIKNLQREREKNIRRDQRYRQRIHEPVSSFRNCHKALGGRDNKASSKKYSSRKMSWLNTSVKKKKKSYLAYLTYTPTFSFSIHSKKNPIFFRRV